MMRNYIAGWAKNRVKHNKNAIIIFTGPTGSGKTYAAIDTCLECAEMMDTNFTIKTNLDFKFREFLTKTALDQNKLPGTAFIFDEAGAYGGGGSSRDWQSQANKLFFSFLQTTRHRRQILILTVPNMRFVDVGARTLTHLIVLMKHINFEKNVSYGSPLLLQVNELSGKIYHKYMRFTRKGETGPMKQQAFRLPPENVLKEYETMKTAYTTELNQGIIDSKDKKKRVMGHIHDMDRLKHYINQGLKVPEIAKLFDVTPRHVYYKMDELKQPQNNILNGLMP